MRYGKPDTTQRGIVDALRRLGVSVSITSGLGKGFPDLTVGNRGRTLLLEVKSPGGHMTEPEEHFHRTWKGCAECVYTIEQAVHALQRHGLLASPLSTPEHN